MRPGRLDRLVYVGPPDLRGREEILRIRLSKMSVDPAINISEIALLVCFHTANLQPPSSPRRQKGVLALKWYQRAKKPLSSQ